MSYSLHAVAFREGETRTLSRAVFDAVFAAYSDIDPQFGFVNLRTPDGGEAKAYGADDGDNIEALAFNHFSPGQVLDLIAEFARRADAVIFAPGCPNLFTSAEQSDHVPEDRREYVVINNGTDISNVLAANCPPTSRSC